jgi:hypothetical protein
MSSFEQKSGSAPAPAITQSSSSSSSSSSTSSNQGPSVTTNNSTYRLPNDLTFQHACKLAIVEDKPLLLDYWTDSLDKKALIGAKENGEKLLVKSEDEYTSTIAKFYKSATEYIVITENSIYVVSNEIPTRKIS